MAPDGVKLALLVDNTLIASASLSQTVHPGNTMPFLRSTSTGRATATEQTVTVRVEQQLPPVARPTQQGVPRD